MTKCFKGNALRLIVVLSALALCVCLLAGCGGKPKSMDQETYDLGKEAISVVESYQKGSLGKSAAYDKLDGIYDDLNSHRASAEGNSKHLSVSIYVSSLKDDLDPKLEGYGEDDMDETLQKLKDTCS